MATQLVATTSHSLSAGSNTIVNNELAPNPLSANQHLYENQLISNINHLATPARHQATTPMSQQTTSISHQVITLNGHQITTPNNHQVTTPNSHRITTPTSHQTKSISHQTTTPIQTVKCVEIVPHKQSIRELSSAQINRAELIDPDIVIRRYPSYHCISRVLTLAQRLASQSYFGDNMLSKCTVMGCRDSPTLPLRELNNLKQKLFLLFPNFWANPLDFEETWTRCTVSIGQRSKRMARGAVQTR